MLFAEMLAACAPASAVTIDPQNDVHCSVLTFYFHGLAKHDGAPEAQVHAKKGLQDWYAAKFRSIAAGRYSNHSLLQREIGPILETIKADPDSMLGATRACVDRAVADPAFNRFARSYSQK